MSDKDNKRSYYNTLKETLEAEMEAKISLYKKRVTELEQYLEVLQNENYKLRDELLDTAISNLEKVLKLRQYEH